MQIILVSRHLKAARTITIMPRHVVGGVAATFAMIFVFSALFSWLSVHWRLPLVDDLLRAAQFQESQKTQSYVSNNLQLMATRLGELQGRVMQLDALGERVAGLAGIKRETPPAAAKPGQGGVYVPAPMTAEELQQAIDRLAAQIDSRADELAVLESRLLEKRVRDRLLPTTMPVKGAALGSPFGHRSDPFLGLRAMHEGLDFTADPGTPVMAAADGVILTAGYHPDYGNVIDIDHGDGLVSRYAHLSRIDVKGGALVKRGGQIGALGSTGRSTGPHLHFEVRMLGVAQDPAIFLRQGAEFAQVRRR